MEKTLAVVAVAPPCLFQSVLTNSHAPCFYAFLPLFSCPGRMFANSIPARLVATRMGLPCARARGPTMRMGMPCTET